MNDTFATFGEQLARDLEAAAQRYHVKSDDHDILDYEAAGILEAVRSFRENRGSGANSVESTLLGEWGRHTRSKEPELTKRALEFYRMIAEEKKTAEPGATDNPDDA
jgi:hypothetical protein